MSSHQPTASGSAPSQCIRKQMHKAKRVFKKKSVPKAEDLKIRDILNKQFKRVTENDIKKFAKEYKGSEEEIEDIRKEWINSKGNLSVVMERVMCTEDGDEPRIRQIVKALVQNKMAPRFKDGPENKWLTANATSKKSRGRSSTPQRSSKKSKKSKSKSPRRRKAGGSRKRKRSTSRGSTRRSKSKRGKAKRRGRK